MLDRRQVFSRTDFLRNYRQHLARLDESAKPVIRTVKGKASLGVQTASRYQSLLDERGHAAPALEADGRAQ